MKKISQATEILALVERGDLNADLSKVIQEVLSTLQDIATQKKSAKGQVKLTLNFEVEGRTVDIETAIDSKVPKMPRSKSTYFVLPDGSLSTEHPQQQSMEFGPREIRAAE